jgi:predicted TIM-barrel fold metal-dependent hydrolase
MFGTDWPVCLLRIDYYKSWADMVRRFVASLSEEEQTAILSLNAARIYDL